MKKRFIIIPAIAIGFAAIVGGRIAEGDRQACAAGDQARCEKHAINWSDTLPRYEKKCADGDKSYCDLVANFKPATLKYQAQAKAERAERDAKREAEQKAERKAEADTLATLGVEFTDVEAEGGWGLKPTAASCTKLKTALDKDSGLANQKPVLNAFMACSAIAKGSFTRNEDLVAQTGEQARRDCIELLKSQLQDPNSLQVQSHSFIRKNNSLGVNLRYTATNGFGGRVQGTYSCG